MKFLFLLVLVSFSACCRPPDEICVYEDPIEIAPEPSIVCVYAPCIKKDAVPSEMHVYEALTDEMFDSFSQKDSYCLAVGDYLEISIFDEKDSTRERVMVAPDGKIYYGFVEGIPAEGRTIDEVKSDLINKIQQYYVDPDISIILETMTAHVYKIFGQVNKPGVFCLNCSIRLREALAQSGVLNKSVDFKNSFIIRNNKKLNIDFEKLIMTASNDQNIYLRPGDYIYISPEHLED